MDQQSASLMQDAFKHCRWETNEAEMIANTLLPTLRRMFAGPDMEIRVEHHIHLRLGTKLYTVDSEPRSEATGRADFLVVDRNADRIIAVVEAKRPGHPLTQDDRDQLGSYMGAVRPVAFFGILSNGNTTEVFGWLDGQVTNVSAFQTLVRVAPSFDEALHEKYANQLLTLSPEYRDQVSTQNSEAKLKPVALASSHPRGVVSELQTRISHTSRSVTIVTSPPQCGKTQVLVDLFERRSGPAIFIDDESPAATVQQFALPSTTARDMFVAYLEARRSATPVLVLVEARGVDPGLARLLDYVANENACCHVVIAANYATTRSLLTRRDHSPLFDPHTPVMVVELGAFTDDELKRLYPTCELDLLKQPFLRLFRWPGLQRVVRDRAFSDINVGDALANWFMHADADTQQAMATLGAFLARHPSSMRQRLPHEFISGQPLYLAQLERNGFVCQIQNPKTGIVSYALACIEIGAYALLAHVFQSEPPNAPLLDEIVKGLRAGDSGPDITALVALLPYFLTDPNPTTTRGRIVRRMLGNLFDTHRLEGLASAKLLDTLEGVRITAPNRAILNEHHALFEACLLALRKQTGHMPNFRGLEQLLGPTLRYDEQRRQQIRDLNLSHRELVNEATLARLTRSQLLDMLWMLAEGDHKWLGTEIENADVVAVGDTIVASLGNDSRLGFPIESANADLAGRITRNQAGDLPIMLHNRVHRKAVLEDSTHVKLLVERVIYDHARGVSQALADCFHYVAAMQPSLLEVLLNTATSEGIPTQFAHVFLEGLWLRVKDLDRNNQARVIHRLVEVVTGEPWLLDFLDLDLLTWLARDFPNSFEELRGATSATSKLTRLRIDLAVEACNLVALTESIESMSMAEVAQVWRLPVFVDLVSFVTDADAWVNGLSADSPARLVASLIELDGAALGTFAVPAAELALEQLRELIVFAPGFPVGTRIGWSRSRVQALVRACVLVGLDRPGLVRLDRLLRAALLRVHESSLNRHLVRELVTQMTSTQLARTALFRRLVLSGFELWEVRLDDDLDCPMLISLLTELHDAAGPESGDLLDMAANWLTRHWSRVRQLPNVTSYTIRHLMGLDGFVSHAINAIAGQSASNTIFIDAVLLLSDMLPWVRALDTQHLMREYARELLAHNPELQVPIEQYSDAWERLRATEHGTTEVETLAFEDLLRDISIVIKAVPQLPAILPEFQPTTHRRSMLTPLENGFVCWNPKAFLDSWRDGV